MAPEQKPIMKVIDPAGILHERTTLKEFRVGQRIPSGQRVLIYIFRDEDTGEMWQREVPVGD